MPNFTQVFRFLNCFGIFLISCSFTICSAQIPGYPPSIMDFDAREVAMLPRYCIFTQYFRTKVPGGDDKREMEHWYTLIGGSDVGGEFHAMHHYCFGLMKTNRALLLARTQQERVFYLADSIVEFDYVLHRAPKGFVLLPEILTKKGENLLRLGKFAQGSTELQRAIEEKPDYWPAYVALSDHFKRTNDLKSARDWIEKGLAASPESLALQQRLNALQGGKELRTTPTPRTKTPIP